MFVLPRGTLVKVSGMPFRLLEDTPTDRPKENYELAMCDGPLVGYGPNASNSHLATGAERDGDHTVGPVTSETISTSSLSMAFDK